MGRKRTRATAMADDAGDDAQSATLKKEEEEELPKAKKARDQQLAKSKSLSVTVDELCPLSISHVVYIDDDRLIFDAMLNQTDVSNNNNKFYHIQLLAPKSSGLYRIFTRWGRVGERGQTATLGNGTLEDALKIFDKKFKDKSGHPWANRIEAPKPKKYTYVPLNYEEESSDEDEGSSKANKKAKTKKKEPPKVKDCTLPLSVQSLMQLIFNPKFFADAMQNLGYDANKLPLGKLSKLTIKMGYQTLKEISELLHDSQLANPRYSMTYAEATEMLTNRYYSYIPHSFGRARPPIIQSDMSLKAEIELLDALRDMELSNEVMENAAEQDSEVHLLDRRFQSLNLTEMSPLDKASSEYQELSDYMINTHGYTHHVHLKVEEIFRIERQGEFERFDVSPYANITNSDRRLLWHGSGAMNFGGILSQGLRIAPPEAPVNGYMFGKGVYLADMSSKSVGYCRTYSTSGIGLLLLCEVELGKPMLELTDSEFTAGQTCKNQGRIATWGKGKTYPSGWKDAGSVHESLKGSLMVDTSKGITNDSDIKTVLQYNEFIVYDVAQIRLRYLFRVNTN